MALPSSWRPALFHVAGALVRGLAGVGQTVLYGAAGLLTSEQLTALIARHWAQFGADRAYILSGLQPWEADFYHRFVRAGDRILVVGGGTGREVIALRREGYRVDGLEPSEAAVARARAMLAETGLAADIRVGTMETAPGHGPWDACIFTWRTYGYIPERARRVAALRAVRERLTPAGRILLSYARRETPPRRLPRAITAAVARLTGSGRRPQATDVLSLTGRGLHFEHQFVPGEIEGEARDARLRLVHQQSAKDEELVVLAAEG